MFRLVTLAWLVAGCGQPLARIEVERLEGTRPEWAILRCRASGFTNPPRFTWKLSAGVRPIGVNQPLDGGALLVQLADNLRGSETVDCVAADKDVQAAAQLSLGPCQVTAARVAAGVLTIDGSGLGLQAGPDDGVFLVPPRGLTRRADHTCKGGSWSDTRIVACLPSLAKQGWQVRVQSGGRLALGPLVTPP
jgi:hypothetical protein